MAAEGQSHKMASDMEVCMKQRCVIVFFHMEKMAPIDIPQCLLHVCRDQTADVSTVRQWVVCFSSGDSGKYFISSYEILMRCFISVYEVLNNVVDHELIFGFSKMIDPWFLD